MYVTMYVRHKYICMHLCNGQTETGRISGKRLSRILALPFALCVSPAFLRPFCFVFQLLIGDDVDVGNSTAEVTDPEESS